MSCAVYWTDTAKADLTNIIEYIYGDSPQNARNVFGLIKEQAKSLSTYPNRGRIVPELQSVGVMNYRELIVERWRLVYRVYEMSVFVIAIIDARQNAEDVLFCRLVGR